MLKIKAGHCPAFLIRIFKNYFDYIYAISILCDKVFISNSFKANLIERNGLYDHSKS